MEDEMLDLVDANDVTIGTINRNEYRRLLDEKLGYIRAAELFILNDQGELWVPVRTAHKTIAPNGYDYGAAGHVESGDDYLETIIRETAEEINVHISPDDIDFVAKLKSPNTRYIRTMYLFRSNITPIFNPEDFVHAAWMTPEKLILAIKDGHPTKESLLASTQVLQNYLLP